MRSQNKFYNLKKSKNYIFKKLFKNTKNFGHYFHIKISDLTFGFLQIKRNTYDVVFTSLRMLEESFLTKKDAMEDEHVGHVCHLHTFNLGK